MLEYLYIFSTNNICMIYLSIFNYTNVFKHIYYYFFLLFQPIPCAFALQGEGLLLEGGSESSHTAIVDIPDIVMLNFKRALILAFSECFPTFSFVGCDFHWKSCLRKNIGAHSLMALYNNDQSGIPSFKKG